MVERFAPKWTSTPSTINRSVPTISYAAFIPKGPPVAHLQITTDTGPVEELLFIGGMFWDGRAETLEHQASFPFQNPNEMNDVAHGLAAPDVVVQKLAASTSAELFRRVFGPHVWNFKDAAKRLVEVGAAVMVSDAAELEVELAELIADPELRERMGRAARELVHRQQGATQKTLSVIEAIVGKSEIPSREARISA